MDTKNKRIEELDKITQAPDFWNNPQEAGKLQKELSDIKAEVKDILELNKSISELKELEELVATDESLKPDFDNHLKQVVSKMDKMEISTFLSGKYDKGDAILTIASGAGGDEAEDWAAMLFRMYQRYADKKGFKYSVLDEARGEVSPESGKAGLKSVSFEISGRYAYGLLKKETGVHRLVRISPFSSQSLRHTSFASVDVLPIIGAEDAKDIELNPADLKIETCKSGGAGGQNVNKRETAVRIVHIPTNISASCQSERSQLLNREKAIKIVKSKLYQLKEKEREAELSQVKGEKKKVEWGSQIRSYVLHPYKMVKDVRTEYQTTQAEDVLEGNLDDFIEAELKNPEI